MTKTVLEPSELQKNRAYSPAVITEGGRTVWLAGQTATVDADGKDISGNFEAQTRRVFALMDQTLRRAGGTLADLVTMAVFITDPRHGDRFVENRSSPPQDEPGVIPPRAGARQEELFFARSATG